MGIDFSEGRGCRKKMPVIDGLLAAAAIANGLVVVTRNSKDIEASGAKCLNPWK